MFSHLIGIEPADKKLALRRGSIMGRYLNIYYYNKIRPKAMFEKILINSIFWTHKIQKETGMSMDLSYGLYSALFKYRQVYKDENWVPLGIEVGFSKLLYEDDENIFTYEGAIDLMLRNPVELAISDHKSESANRPIYQFNNQCIGYLWASGATQFIYNYITLTKVPVFHRSVHKFTPIQIEDWRLDTIEWFKRVKKSIQEKSFLKSRKCVDIYGKCAFTTICEQPKPELKQYIIGANYKRRKPYRSW